MIITPPDPLPPTKARTAVCSLVLERYLGSAQPCSSSAPVQSHQMESLGPSSKEGARGTRESTIEHEVAEGLRSVEGADKEKDLPLLGLALG